jgi:hypothetical protein
MLLTALKSFNLVRSLSLMGPLVTFRIILSQFKRPNCHFLRYYSKRFDLLIYPEKLVPPQFVNDVGYIRGKDGLLIGLAEQLSNK